jgi:hypothetical protein
LILGCAAGGSKRRGWVGAGRWKLWENKRLGDEMWGGEVGR